MPFFFKGIAHPKIPPALGVTGCKPPLLSFIGWSVGWTLNKDYVGLDINFFPSRRPSSCQLSLPRTSQPKRQRDRRNGVVRPEVFEAHNDHSLLHISFLSVQ